MQPTPIKIHSILERDICPISPMTPIVVVKIRIMGPTNASELFTTSAFSTELNLIMSIAAAISMQPDRILKRAIPKTAISIKIT